jgi:hypothetical protein
MPDALLPPSPEKTHDARGRPETAASSRWRTNSKTLQHSNDVAERQGLTGLMLDVQRTLPLRYKTPELPTHAQERHR